MKGKRVATWNVDVYREVAKKLGAKEIKAFDVEALLYEALDGGAVDFLVYDSPLLRYHVSKSKGALATLPGLVPGTETAYQVLVRAGEPGLLEAVNAAIEKWRARPETKAMLGRFLPGDPSAG